jgi:hypothetical protein
VDPLSGLTLGSIIGNAAGNLVTKAVEGVAKSVKQRVWVDADELGRLFHLMDAAFADELPAMTHAELERTWRPNRPFMEVFERLSSGEDVAEGALAEVIEPLVGPTADKSARELAAELAQALRYLLPEAKDDTPRVLYEMRQFEQRIESRLAADHAETSEQLGRIESTVARNSDAFLILSSDWPSAAEDALKRTSAVDEPGLRKLMQALDDKNRARELPTLINTGRPWMVDLSAAAWELLAVLCQEEGLWPEAQRAWLAAREKPGADWAGCTVRAAEAAVQADDRATAVELLNAAREDDERHPRVLFHDALLKQDPQDVLAALNAIETTDRALAAAVQVAKVSAHVEMNDFAGARAALGAAASAGAGETLSYRMAETTLSMQEMLGSERPSATAAVQFSDSALELEGELLKRNQLAQAAGVRAQAAAFHGFIGDLAQAQALLADAVDTYNQDQLEPRLQLAMAAANLQSYDIVETLIPPEDDRARARYLRAALRSRGDDEDKQAAAQDLDDLVSHEDDEVRNLAALRRLAISGEAPGIDWSDAAAAVVESRHLAPAVVFKAFWLENAGRHGQAERELLAHSDETWALAELMRLAGRTEDWAKAARYADALLGRELDWATHLSAAEALRLGGDDARALAEFEKLAKDENAPPAVRADAYRRLTELAYNSEDYARTVSLTDGWLQVEPDNADAAWVRVLALAVLGRDHDALAAIADRDLHPRQPSEYRIAAQLHLNTGDANDVVQKVVALADEHDPPSEEMEAFVVAAALRAPTIPDDLRDRVSFERFTKLFPTSQRLQARSFEDFKQYLEQDLAERAGHIQAVEDQVFKDGQMPSAVLALVTNNDIGGLWMRLSWGTGLPMGYGNLELDELERQDARAALGGAVVWDGSSVFTVGHVLPDLTEAIRTTFPNGRITQAALADIAEGVRELSLDDGERKEVGYNLAEGAPEFREWDRDLADSYRKRAQGALDFAHKLTPCPDSDPAAPQPEDAEFDDVEESGFRALLASYSAARRLKMPIYSDDRDVRRRARANGLPAFGTIALLDVLAESEHISSEERAAARRALLAVRAYGVRPSIDELLAMGQNARWKLTLELGVSLMDRGPWVEDTAETFLTWQKFLRHVHHEAPDELLGWVTRLLDAAHQARPELTPAFLAQHLVTMSLFPTEASATEFVRAVIANLGRARRYLATGLGDPSLAGFAALVGHLARHPRPDLVGPLVARIWTMLPLADQPRALPLLISG